MAAAPKKFKYTTYKINCQIPVNANIFDFEGFTEFLVTKFRPTKTGKPGNVGQFSTEFSAAQNKAAIGKSVIVSANKDKDIVYIHTKTPLSKKYLKFLTKKFLARNSLRDIVRLNAYATRKELTLKFYTAIGGQDLAGGDDADAEDVE